MNEWKFYSIINIIKITIISFLFGALISSYIIFKYYNNKVNIPLSKISTKQISGKTITHSKMIVSKRKLIFNTQSDGKGEIVTQIPLQLIPEASNWINKTDLIMLGVGKSNINATILSIGYYHRWENFGLGGDFNLTNKGSNGYGTVIIIKGLWMF